MNIQEIEGEIILEFASFEDWLDKYNHIIESARNIPRIEPKYKEEKFLIQGCQSQVWLRADLEDGKVIFTADSDALITRGIIAPLIRVLSNQPPQDIIDAKLEFIEKTGLHQHLSPTCSNGLASMVKQMKLYAIAFKAQTEAQ